MMKVRLFITNWTYAGFEDFHFDMESSSIEKAIERFEKNNDMARRNEKGEIMRYGFEIQGAEEL